MAWKDTLLDASFRGVTFDCLSTDDSGEKALARHGYPFADGEDIEDLGLRGNQFSMVAVFNGDDYESRLQRFLAAIRARGSAELIHPIFGSIPSAQVAGYRVRHDAETIDYAEVDVTFLESTASADFFLRALPADKSAAIANAAGAAKAAAVPALAKSVDKLAAARNLMKRLNGIRSAAAGALSSLRSKVGDVVGLVQDFAAWPRAFAADIEGGLRGLAKLRLPFLSSDGGAGQVAAADSTMAGWHSLVRDGKETIQATADAVSLPNPVDQVRLTAPGDVPVEAGGLPSGVAVEAPALPEPEERYQERPATIIEASGPADDLGRVIALVQTLVAAQLAETAAAIFEVEGDVATLSPADIERISNDVREAAQVGILMHRGWVASDDASATVSALKDIAHTTQEAARALIQARPPLVQRQVESDTNLHLLAFRWYGDYTRAAELARLNPALRHPNFIQAGEVLNAFSA